MRRLGCVVPKDMLEEKLILTAAASPPPGTAQTKSHLL